MLRPFFAILTAWALLNLAATPARSADGGERMRKLEHGWQVLAVAFSADGKMLASGSADRTAKIWDPGTGHVRRALPKEC